MAGKPNRTTTQQAYNRLWRKTARSYGQAGTPPPRLQAVKRGGGYAYTMGSKRPGEAWQPSERTVFGNPVYRQQLKSNKKAARNASRFATLHEWGHLFGPKGSGPTGNEGEANRAANIAARRMNRKTRAAQRRRK